MTYACPAWEFASGCHLLKLQHLQNKVLPTNGKFPKCTLIRKLHMALMAFRVPYVYDFVKKLCRRQAVAIQNHENANVHDIGRGEAQGVQPFK
jgi:hypothetical protein